MGRSSRDSPPPPPSVTGGAQAGIGGPQLQTRYAAHGHTLYGGDALAVLRQGIADNSVDLVFADPPYNIGKRFGEFPDTWPSEEAYVAWCQEWLALCLAKLKPTGSLYLMARPQRMPHLDLYLWLRTPSGAASSGRMTVRAYRPAPITAPCMNPSSTA